MTERPNIVFFFTDDQRMDTISALGNAAIETPNIDRLVRMGTSFTRAHIPGGTVPAVCMPSRAMLHSGRTLFHLAGAGKDIPDTHTTLGEALRQAGYHTFGTGKWHNGSASFHRSFSAGDEIFFGGMTDHWMVPACRYDPSGRYDSVCQKCTDPRRTNKTQALTCDHVTPGVHSSELVCDAASEFIRTRHADEAPFFCYISFLAPHDPRTMPEAYRERYNAHDIELPPNFSGGHPFKNGALHVRDEELADFPRDREEIRGHIADYYAMITHLDAEMGKVFAALEEQGMMHNTLFVLAGDNGLAVGQHGLLGKQNLYDHSVRVPLVFAGPGIPQNERREAFAYLLDIFPTLCDLVSVPIPESVEGKSLVPVIRENRSVRDELYLAFGQTQRGVRDARYKLIEYVVEGRHNMTQLFDLDADPWEVRNLAEDPIYAEKLNEMRNKLLRHCDAWDDRASVAGQQFWAGFDRG